jgi:hypothetical protein
LKNYIILIGRIGSANNTANFPVAEYSRKDRIKRLRQQRKRKKTGSLTASMANRGTGSDSGCILFASRPPPNLSSSGQLPVL